MKKSYFAIALISAVLLVGLLNGCDNRSDLEKGMDKTAKKANDMLK